MRTKLQPSDEWKLDPTYNEILSLLDTYGKDPIVDSGANDNKFKDLVKKKLGKDIVGIDIHNNPLLDFVYNGRCLPFKDESVNTFTSNFVLEHVDDQELYLEELHRCLGERGIVILSVPRPVWYVGHLISPYSHYIAFKRFLNWFRLRGLYAHGRPHRHGLFKEIGLWKEKRYEDMIQKAGFFIYHKVRSSHILALDRHYAKLFRKLVLPDFLKISVTYLLVKRQR